MQSYFTWPKRLVKYLLCCPWADQLRFSPADWRVDSPPRSSPALVASGSGYPSESAQYYLSVQGSCSPNYGLSRVSPADSSTLVDAFAEDVEIFDEDEHGWYATFLDVGDTETNGCYKAGMIDKRDGCFNERTERR